MQADRFTLYVHEAPNKDGPHTSEAVSYLVLEAGSWELPDGTLLQVGTLNTSATVGKLITNQWEHVDFGLPFSAAPAVLSQVQTNDDPHWVKTRQDDVTATGVKLALEEEEEKTSPHGSERMGWLAMEVGLQYRYPSKANLYSREKQVTSDLPAGEPRAPGSAHRYNFRYCQVPDAG